MNPIVIKLDNGHRYRVFYMDTPLISDSYPRGGFVVMHQLVTGEWVRVDNFPTREALFTFFREAATLKKMTIPTRQFHFHAIIRNNRRFAYVYLDNTGTQYLRRPEAELLLFNHGGNLKTPLAGPKSASLHIYREGTRRIGIITHDRHGFRVQREPYCDPPLLGQIAFNFVHRHLHPETIAYLEGQGNFWEIE